jgi:hypothetical protein
MWHLNPSETAMREDEKKKKITSMSGSRWATDKGLWPNLR